MDRFVAALEATPDADLMLCEADGVAYQADMTARVEYGADYLAKCAANDAGPHADAINEARIALVDRHYGSGRCCDIGIGHGAFVRRRPATFGHDVNPLAVAWLAKHGRLAKLPAVFGAFTFWDVLEHCPRPADYLDLVPLHGFAFASIPVFDDLRAIRASRHYRPGEHLYYWTDAGFRDWMGWHGFNAIEANDAETLAGRESIRSYAFKRARWPTSSR